MNGIRERSKLLLSWSIEALAWWAFLHALIVWGFLALMMMGVYIDADIFNVYWVLDVMVVHKYVYFFPNYNYMLFGPLVVWFGLWFLTGRVRILPWRRPKQEEVEG